MALHQVYYFIRQQVCPETWRRKEHRGGGDRVQGRGRSLEGALARRRNPEKRMAGKDSWLNARVAHSEWGHA